MLKDSSESTVFKANPLKEKCLINRRFGNLFSKLVSFVKDFLKISPCARECSKMLPNWDRFNEFFFEILL